MPTPAVPLTNTDVAALASLLILPVASTVTFPCAKISASLPNSVCESVLVHVQAAERPAAFRLIGLPKNIVLANSRDFVLAVVSAFEVTATLPTAWMLVRPVSSVWAFAVPQPIAAANWDRQLSGPLSCTAVIAWALASTRETALIFTSPLLTICESATWIVASAHRKATEMGRKKLCTWSNSCLK